VGAVGRGGLGGGRVDRYRGRRGVVEHRDGDRGGGGAVAGGIARHRGQRVRAVARSGRVPGDRVGRGRVFHAEVGAIEQELHADDSDVVGGVGCHAGGAAHSGSRDRRGDANRRRRGVVEHRDGDRGGGGAVAGGIARDGGQRVRAVARGGGVPGNGVRCRGVFHAEVGAVQQELHADDSDVVGGGGCHAGGAAHS